MFVDYGGGCGMLSFLAKETGFKTVVYNDVYNVSATDACVIAGNIQIPVNYFIVGDAKAFAIEMNTKNLNPDLICSFDVLEHIYDWKLWIKNITTINSGFSLLFMTSANSANPFVRRRLKKFIFKPSIKASKKTKAGKNWTFLLHLLRKEKRLLKQQVSILVMIKYICWQNKPVA